MLGIVAYGAALGAEVSGWQPERDLTDKELAQLRAALGDRLVLVLRGQPTPTDEQLAGLARRLGQVYAGGNGYGVPMPHPDILRVSNEVGPDGYEVGIAGSGQLPWHTDYSFLPTPARETLLEAVLLPPSGGPATYFCDMYAAWETLAEESRGRVAGRVAIHAAMASASYLGVAGNTVAGNTVAGNTVDPDAVDPDAAARAARRHPRAELPGNGGPAWHPLVVRHPLTGRSALYVSEFVAAIEGMDDQAAHQLVVDLLAHATRPERVYRHDWRVGDLVVFDTVGTVHRRDLSRHTEMRTMRQLSTVLAAGLAP